ncbi:MAG: fibro-slime domain-containing protein [Fibrobacterota bacterium]|nr:MAG: fibro-slime domain-containing protein [Fibrobacterota bacterium]
MAHPAQHPPLRRSALGRMRLGWLALVGALGSVHGGNPKTAVAILTGSSSGSSGLALHGTLYDYKLRNLRGQDTSLYFPFSHKTSTGPVPGLLAHRLDQKGRPVWTGKAICDLQMDSTRPCESPLNAPDRWFRARPEKNAQFSFALNMQEFDGDSLGFVDDFFFPLDTFRTLPVSANSNPFFDQQLGLDLESHNFGFCLELHGKVQSKTGGKFSVTGDDDTWVFVDSQLVVDMGGTHPAQTQSIPLEPRSGGIGTFVSLDIFHCDRQSNESVFALATNVPVLPADSVTSEQPVSSIGPSLPLCEAISLRARNNALSITAPAGQAWILELRGLDGRLQRAVSGSGAALVPWTNSGISLALLRSGSETVSGRFVQHSRN